jgi:hypothetical protein
MLEIAKIYENNILTNGRYLKITMPIMTNREITLITIYDYEPDEAGQCSDRVVK